MSAVWGWINVETVIESPTGSSMAKIYAVLPTIKSGVCNCAETVTRVHDIRCARVDQGVLEADPGAWS